MTFLKDFKANLTIINMRVCVLTYEGIRQSKEFYVRLMDELKKKFSSVTMIPIEKVTMKITSKGTSIMYRNKELDEFDVLLPRIGPSHANYGFLILSQLEGKVYFPNKPMSYLIARDKVFNLMVLASKGIPIPKTIVTISKKVARNLTQNFDGSLIVKAEGKSGGKGVIFARDFKSANTMIDALSLSKGEKLLLEEYVKAKGDVRLFVIGDKVEAAAMRVSSDRDVRSNIHAGGKYVNFDPPQKIKKLAIRAAKAIGAEICGVDVLIGEGKPVVLECNMNPGFYITKVTGINLFKRITDYVYENGRKFYSGENMFVDFISDVLRYFRDHL